MVNPETYVIDNPDRQLALGGHVASTAILDEKCG